MVCRKHVGIDAYEGSVLMNGLVDLPGFHETQHVSEEERKLEEQEG